MSALSGIALLPVVPQTEVALGEGNSSPDSELVKLQGQLRSLISEQASIECEIASLKIKVSCLDDKAFESVVRVRNGKTDRRISELLSRELQSEFLSEDIVDLEGLELSNETPAVKKRIGELARVLRKHNEFYSLPDYTASYDRLEASWEAASKVANRMVELPASDIADLRAKASALDYYLSKDESLEDPGIDVRLTRAIVRDLLRT